MRSAARLWSALVTLVAFMGVFALPVLSPGHLRGDGDIDCGSADLVLRSPTPQLDVPVPVAPSDHCALCHLQRVVRSAAASAPATAVQPAQWSDALAPQTPAALSEPSSDRPPARAPPVLVVS